MCIRHGPQLQFAFNLVQDGSIFINKKGEKGITQGHITNEQHRQLRALKGFQRESALEWGRGERSGRKR